MQGFLIGFLTDPRISTEFLSDIQAYYDSLPPQE